MVRTRNAGRALLAVLLATAVLAGGVSAGSDVVAPDAVSDATAGTHGCSFPYTSTDATDTEVTIEEEPQSVVTLNPSAAQTMWEIGAEDKVVGVTKYATYLDGAGEKKNISGAGYTTVVNEKVIGLEPDLVLVPNANDEERVEKLREAGLTVYMFDRAESLDDVANKTRLTGGLVGECDAAAKTVAEMNAEIDTVSEAVDGEQRPSVLFVLGPSGYTAGNETFIHTAIETAGGHNIAAEENITGYKAISPEVVAAQDPDWIVKPSGVALPDSEVYNESTAVQEGNVLEVERNFISQPAPQIIRPIRTMAKTFHPEAYAAANTTPTAPQTPAGTETSADSSPSPTPASGPGFGLAAGFVAIVLAVAFTRRD